MPKEELDALREEQMKRGESQDMIEDIEILQEHHLKELSQLLELKHLLME